ncbi:MAG: TorD/DmsD family molecular chaperone [Burkholderiales bacterium]
MQGAADSVVPDEDQARAHCYALISRLFYAPADADLLGLLSSPPAAAIQQALPSENADAAPDTDPYTSAFAALQEVCRTADADTVRREYDDLFVGAGRALISPYTSGYTVPHAPDRHLVALRERLSSFALARRDAVFELEDHVSAVCDVMRWLIERGRSIDEQRAFFDEFVCAGVSAFCTAIETRAPTSFHRAVAAVALAFIAIEKHAFELHAGE